MPVAVGLNAIQRETPARVACTVMDLTDLKRAAEQFRRFFDLSRDLFCIAQVNGSFLRVDANFSRLLGYSSKELLSSPFFEFIRIYIF